jgi:hypothetical protein
MLLAALCFMLPLMLIAQPITAQDIPQNLEAQHQVDTALVSLRDSEAETASGSYVPGSGAFFTIELIRGPNTAVDDAPYQGVRDWAIYLMSNFGPQLSAVPAGEVIAFTIRYYDYIDGSFHYLTLAAPANATAAVDRYTIWLDGAIYNQDSAQQTETDRGGDVPTAIPTSSTVLIFEPTTEPAPATPVASPALPSTASPTVAGLPVGTLTFDTADAISPWAPVGGTWIWSNGAYEQTELNRFDLIAYYDQPLTALTRLSTDLRFVQGQMGAGLVFAAPSSDSKNNAQMVSFAANGTFLQWGYYDDAGVFQYQGGVPVSPGTADQAWHTLEVTIADGSYGVTLDGVALGQEIPLIHGPDGYAGLLSSTANTQFDNVTIEVGP